MPNEKNVHSSRYFRNQAFKSVKSELPKIANLQEQSIDDARQDQDKTSSVASDNITNQLDIELTNDSLPVVPHQSCDISVVSVHDVQQKSELVLEASAILTEQFLSACSNSVDEVSECSTDSDNDENDNEGEENNVKDFLHMWSSKFNIANNAVDSLLAFLKPFHPTLPLSSKTLKQSPRTTNMKILHNGQYAHIGLQKGLLRRLVNGFAQEVDKVLVDVFVDGVRIYNNSSEESWPIMARCVDFVDARPFLVGIFYGSSKPNPIEEYLAQYIEEVKNLKVNGLSYRGENYSFDIRYYLGEAPGRAYLKCVIGHTSKHGCERCDQCGDFDDMVIYSPNFGAERTDQSFDAQRDPDHHKGNSPLMELSTRFITQFVLDPMHLVDIRVFKRFLPFVLRRGPPNARLTGEDLEDFEELLDLYSNYVPCDFSRKHPTLDRRPKWKATEYRLLLLYLCVVIFKLLLKEEMFQLFLLLHSAIFIMSSDIFIGSYLDEAEHFIEQFVAYSSKIFGSKFVVYNVHSLLHLSADVRKHGCLSKFSRYSFEDMGGSLKKLVRSSAKPLQQICRRLEEKESIANKIERSSVNGRGPLHEHNDGSTANLSVSSQFQKN